MYCLGERLKGKIIFLRLDNNIWSELEEKYLNKYVKLYILYFI